MQLNWGVPRDGRSTFKVMEITTYSGENYEDLIKVDLSYFPEFEFSELRRVESTAKTDMFSKYASSATASESTEY